MSNVWKSKFIQTIVFGSRKEEVYFIDFSDDSNTLLSNKIKMPYYQTKLKCPKIINY